MRISDWSSDVCSSDLHRLDRLWTLVQDTCPLPLLDHWRDTVLALLQTRRMLTGLPLALGPLEGHRLALDVPALTKALGELIRTLSRSEEHTSELQSLMRISYAVFCLTKKQLQTSKQSTTSL